MHVECRCYGQVRDRVGERTVTLDLPEGASVGAAVDALVRAHPGLDRPAVVVKDGRNVRHLQGEDTPLADGDVLSLSSTAMPE